MPTAAEPRTRGGNRILWIVVAGAVVVCVLTAIAVWLAPTTPPPVVRGPMYPRTRMPGGSMPLGDLLRGIGIGSVAWYGSILSAPFFLWMSRRVPIDRENWRRGVPLQAVVIIALVAASALLQYHLTFSGPYPARPWPATSAAHC